MKTKIAVIFLLCPLYLLMAGALYAADFIISNPFAFKERFPEGSKQLGLPEGDVLQVGCMIRPDDSSVKEVTIKNLDSGLILKAVPIKTVSHLPGLYEVDPLPPFNASKHMGIWEIIVTDQSGEETVAKTAELNVIGDMPYVKGIKGSGDPLAPTISWTEIDPNDMPQGVEVRYRVILLKDGNNQFYFSGTSSLPAHAVPPGIIKAEDLSEIYVRIQCQGFDKNDRQNSYPLEFQTSTILPLKDILENQ